MASRANTDCVKVALRVRPLIGVEIARGDNECVVSYPHQTEPQIQIGGDKCFTFDYIFRETSQQKLVYDQCIKPLVMSFLEGYNATVIAYGQTGSGKTYTMGTLGCDDAKLQEEWGVIPSAIHDIFNNIHLENNNNENDYKIQCSFIEIYNEEIKDLLDPHTTKSMQIRENPDGASKIHIPNMKLEHIHNAMDMAEALDRGGASRATAYTKMNEQSSRSHAIFTIHLHHIKPPPDDAESDSKNSEPMVIQSKFHFVDLAGSERAKKTGATGTRLLEGISINGGLLALGNVIAALGDARLKSKHVPFRDSKITRLLQDSLGGNSRTLMIACVSPARSNMLETKNTLNYANRAKNIKNKAVVNRDPRSRQILQLRQRVKELERQLNVGGSGSGSGSGSGRRNGGRGTHTYSNDVLQQQIEQINQLQNDLNDSNSEVIKLQEKIKKLRLNLSELQDKYYSDVSVANSDLKMEKMKRMNLINKIKETYGDNVDLNMLNNGEFNENEEKEIKEQVIIMEKLKLENDRLKLDNQKLNKTIISNESREHHIVHNLHQSMAKLVKGDFTIDNNINLLPELSILGEERESTNVILLQSDDDCEEEELEDEFEDSDDDDDDDDDINGSDDNDISMSDPKQKENKKKLKETNCEKEKLKQEHKINVTYKKKLLKEQKCHNKQMEFIEHEQISRERSQRLISEKYNREIDRTSRDISNLQIMLKQLCQQRQSDVGKQAFYEKQVHSLTEELNQAHRQVSLYEVEKSKLNPNDIKKLQAQDIKIHNYQSKMKSLQIQIKSYKDKLGQIRKLKALHKEDMLKMNQMTRKLSDLKRKKVNLQRKLKDENKTYAKWKQQSEKTIKQLRKIQREKNIQLQRHKTQLAKTTSALKQKTAALVNLKKRQREMELKKNKNRRSQIRNSRNKNGNVKQIKNKVAKLLSSLIMKHQLFSKYKSFDREYKSLQHELNEYEMRLKNTNRVLNQLNNNNNNQNDDDDNKEFNRLSAEKLEYEQRIEDTQSTIKYIREQMISMSYKMKDIDHKRWKHLQNAQKVSLSCTECDLDKFLSISSIPYARMCINFLINQHLRFRLIIDDYKKQTMHLKSEQNKILTAADNEMRKKMVLIEKLQNRINEQQQKHRYEQIKSATNTIDDDININEIENDNESVTHSDNGMMVDNDTDNDTDNDLDIINNSNQSNNNSNNNSPEIEIIPLEQSLEADLQAKQNELNESKKKLQSMFCSPQINKDNIHKIMVNDASYRYNNNNNNNNNCKSSSIDNSERNSHNISHNSSSNFSNSFRDQLNNNYGRNKNVLGVNRNGQISIQLTPFHTPLDRKKTRSFTNNSNQMGMKSFLNDNTMGNNNNNNNNNIIMVPNSHRSSSNSPLFGSQMIGHNNENMNDNNNENENHINHMNQSNRAQSLNVFSRLTNPKHFTATSRTKAQELEALKEKIRKQKESHLQLTKRTNWCKKGTHMSPPIENINNNNSYDWNNNSTVFDRLHNTSIRNTRPNHLNNSFNGDIDINNNDTVSNYGGLSNNGLLNQPSRICNQNEMLKKPQRNMNNNQNNNNSKSLLSNPVRVLTPDI